MVKKVHFLGIGGSGTSAAAALAQAQGFKVNGCDLEPSNEFTTKFQPNQLIKGHSPDHLGGHPKDVLARHPQVSIQIHPKGVHANIDILAVTPAIFSLDPNNPELVQAKKLGIPILTWQQFLGEYLTKNKFVIAVCGTHGKTTTTAIIAQMLEDAGLDPTVELGAINPRWGTNYRTQRQKGDDRQYFVIEADEFNDNFLHLKPDIVVVTNIEMDHPEYFKDFKAVKDSFKKFLLQTKSTIVANLLDPGISEVLKSIMKTPKGQKYHDRNNFVQYLDYSKNELNFPLQIPGEFNKLNTQAALRVGLLLKINPTIIKKSLSNYTGVGRRFEYIGEYKKAKVYSDFGHHPTEIKVTMQAARQKFPQNRIILIYEPHMFSRTKVLFDDFVKVFKELTARPAKLQRSGVDKIIITDIYPSREVDTGLVNSQQLVEAVGYDTLVYHSKNQLLPMLKKHIQNGDIVFFMGAGDIDKYARKLLF